MSRVLDALTDRPQTTEQVADRFIADVWGQPAAAYDRLRQRVLRQLIALWRKGKIVGSVIDGWRRA